jgi:integrase
MRGVFERPKGSGCWWIRFAYKGKIKKQKIGTYEEACAAVDKKRVEIREGAILPANLRSRKLRFTDLAENYLKVEHGEHSGKSATTTKSVKFYVSNYIVPKWGERVVDEIAPRDIRPWLYELRDRDGLSGPTIQKIKNIMSAIFGYGKFEGIVNTNPCDGWKLKGVSSTHIPVTVEPSQVREIIFQLADPIHRFLVLLCAATGLRASECCGLQWRDIDWEHEEINVRRRWTAGALGKPKTERSAAPVPMFGVLAKYLELWRKHSPYPGDQDYVFPSVKEKGRIPLSAGIFVTDHLRPAAIKSGVKIMAGQNFGLHSLRSSLATWLVSVDKSDVKTAQSILRHKNSTMTLDKYAMAVRPEMNEAQERYLLAMGLPTEPSTGTGSILNPPAIQ